MIGGSALFSARIEQLAALTAHYAVPAIYIARVCHCRWIGKLRWQCRRRLSLSWCLYRSYPQGAKPAELPVQQAAKVELYINLKTAKALGITVPLPLSGRADEIIE